MRNNAETGHKWPTILLLVIPAFLAGCATTPLHEAVKKQD